MILRVTSVQDMTVLCGPVQTDVGSEPGCGGAWRGNEYYGDSISTRTAPTPAQAYNHIDIDEHIHLLSQGHGEEDRAAEDCSVAEEPAVALDDVGLGDWDRDFDVLSALDDADDDDDEDGGDVVGESDSLGRAVADSAVSVEVACGVDVMSNDGDGDDDDEEEGEQEV